MNTTIGDRLRAQRERLGVTQAGLAEAGGVQRRAQLNYEAGDRFPDAAYLAAVAQVGVDVLYVLTGVRSIPIASLTEPARDRFNQLIDDFAVLPDELQAHACDYVGGLALRAVRENRAQLIRRREISVEDAQRILDERLASTAVHDARGEYADAPKRRARTKRD